MAPQSRSPNQSHRQEVHKLLHALLEEVENQWLAKSPTEVPAVDVPAAARQIVTLLESGTSEGEDTPVADPAERARKNLSALFEAQHARGSNDMSPNQAADFLRMSRGTLNKMLRSGELQFRTRKVGVHTRILRADVEAYWDSLMRQRDAVKDELVSVSEEAGMYGRPSRRSK